MKKLLSLILAILTLALCIVPIAASAEEAKSGTLVDDVNYIISYFPMAKSAKYTNWDNPFRVEYYYNYQSCFYLVDSVKDVFVNTKADNWEYDEAKFNTFAENDKKAKKTKAYTK